jgi:hypothetical protein
METRDRGGFAHRHLAGLFAGFALVLGLTAQAAPAVAASISVSKPCYVFTKSTPATMVVTGSGFVASDQVTITNSAVSGSTTVTAGPTGGFVVAVPAPEPGFSLPGQQTVTMIARDFASNGTITATTPVTVAPLSVATSPGQAPLTRKITWYLSGFSPDSYVYVHYLHNGPVARARLGRATGACGLLKVRARLYPGGHPRYKKYAVQIDDSRRFSKHASPRIERVLEAFAV